MRTEKTKCVVLTKGTMLSDIQSVIDEKAKIKNWYTVHLDNSENLHFEKLPSLRIFAASMEVETNLEVEGTVVKCANPNEDASEMFTLLAENLGGVVIEVTHIFYKDSVEREVNKTYLNVGKFKNPTPDAQFKHDLLRCLGAQLCETALSIMKVHDKF